MFDVVLTAVLVLEGRLHGSISLDPTALNHHDDSNTTYSYVTCDFEVSKDQLWGYPLGASIDFSLA